MLLRLVAPHGINRHVLKLQEKEEERSTSTPHVCFVFRSGAGLLSASKNLWGSVFKGSGIPPY